MQMAHNHKGMFQFLYVHQKCSFYLQNADLLVHSDHKPLVKIFTGHMDKEKCNSWGLEADMLKFSILRE